MKMNKKGFTLMEMLIVIAIIAILIAIAIPTFTSALEKSRQRTDMANVRSLKSLAVADYMSEGGEIAALGKEAKTAYCYLEKGGQSFRAFTGEQSSGDGLVTLEAAWENKSPDSGADYGKGDLIEIILDLNNNGLVIGSTPYIPGNAS